MRLDTDTDRTMQGNERDKKRKMRGWILGKWSETFCATFPFAGDIIPSVGKPLGKLPPFATVDDGSANETDWRNGAFNCPCNFY